MNWRWIGTRGRRLRRREEGQDLIEYALLAALIAVAALTVVNGVATVIKTKFWDVAATLF